ncbi:MAG: NlpC/P60 family protein [Gammaproteobacteria bacterium]|nr:NlpC/P60 family protein [Gammaproteobacteria bacterium]
MPRTRSRRTGTLVAGLVLVALAAPAVRAQQAELPVIAETSPAPGAFQSADGNAPEVSATGFASETVRAAQQVVSYAMQMVGTAYRFGGAEPAVGFDCSGLVQYVYRQVTGVTLPRTSKSLSRVGAGIPMVDLHPGDLVFFNTRRFAFSHVGIYIGNNQFVHAPRTGERVEVSTIDSRYWQRRFNGARRLMGSVPGILPELVNQASVAATEAFMPDAAETSVDAGR